MSTKTLSVHKPPAFRTHESARRLWYRSALPETLNSVFAPAPRLTLSEWADAYRFTSPESNAAPGRWRTTEAPYQREIMDTLTTPGVRQVVVVSGSQMGKTEIGLNLVGYFIHQDPAPILVVQPSLAMAETWSKDRLAPMLRDTPVLRGKVKEPRSKDSQNTILHKRFDGGHLTVVGANSAAGLASRPIRVVIFDEVDRYPDSAGSEGDPIKLGERRTATFWNSLIFKVSTPGLAPPEDMDATTSLAGASRIWPDLMRSDWRKFFVPCPYCGTMQVLEWEQLKWDKEVDEHGNTKHFPETAAYECAVCHRLIEHHQKRAMLARGEWRPTNPEGRFPGFHISALYSNAVTWQEIAEEWLSVYRDPEQRKTFVNTVLARLYREENESFNPSALDARRETWTAEVPNGVGVLTCSVDVQGDRLEVAVWGWGEGEECWLITHERIYGDPEALDAPGIPSVWSRLEALRTRAWKTESGRDVRIWVTMIDAGYLDSIVYRYVHGRETAGVFAVVGSDSGKNPLFRQQKPNRYGVRPWTIVTPPAKDVLFRRLAQREPGPGYIHFCQPTQTGADAEFMAQWGAEVAEWKRENGRLVRRYKRVRRNEAIDLYVYGRAALHTLDAQTLATLGQRAQQLSQPAGEATPPAITPPAPKPRRGNWATKW